MPRRPTQPSNATPEEDSPATDTPESNDPQASMIDLAIETIGSAVEASAELFNNEDTAMTTTVTISTIMPAPTPLYPTSRGLGFNISNLPTASPASGLDEGGEATIQTILLTFGVPIATFILVFLAAVMAICSGCGRKRQNRKTSNGNGNHGTQRRDVEKDVEEKRGQKPDLNDCGTAARVNSGLAQKQEMNRVNDFFLGVGAQRKKVVGSGMKSSQTEPEPPLDERRTFEAQRWSPQLQRGVPPAPNIYGLPGHPLRQFGPQWPQVQRDCWLCRSAHCPGMPHRWSPRTEGLRELSNVSRGGQRVDSSGLEMRESRAQKGGPRATRPPLTPISVPPASRGASFSWTTPPPSYTASDS